MKKLLVILILLIAVSAIHGDPPSGNIDPKKICDLFMAQLIKGDVNKAFKIMEPHIVIPKKDFKSVVKQTINQRKVFRERFGSTIGYELTREKRVKNFLIQYTYAEKCKVHVIRWSFIFYKPENKWVLNSFFWDDKIQYLFR